MALNITNIEQQEIVKEGWLEKKSKHIRSWRKRWVVLTVNNLSCNLYTFKTENEYKDATGIINLSNVSSVSTKNNTQFYINDDTLYNTYFKCKGLEEQEQWVNIIEGYKNSIRVPAVVDCEDNKDYSSEFELVIPYHKNYTYHISDLVIDIIKQIQYKHNPEKFYAIKIQNNSFIDQEVYDWKHCNANIIDYSKDILTSKGLHIVTSVANNVCKHMSTENDLCPIYAKMKYHAGDNFTEENLNHLFEYNHFKNELIEKSECKFAEKCKAYKRLLDGGNELKDRCHVKIFRHHNIAPLHTTKSSTDDIKDDILKNVDNLSKINEKLQAINIEEWEKSRNYVILQIATLSDALEKVIKDVGIAKSAGGGAVLVGGVLSATGLGLAPFSAGTSLGLTVAGSSLMLAGGTTSLISDIVKSVKEKGTVKQCVEAYENIQPDTRKVAFLLDDYHTTFTATAYNISIWNSLILGASSISKSKGIYDVIIFAKAMSGYNALKLAADFSKAGGIQHVQNALFGGIKFGQKIVYQTGSVLAKSIGWIGCVIGVGAGIWEIINGIKTIKDAENAIIQFRVLSVDIQKQTDAIKTGYEKVTKLHLENS
eukprot:208126_1